MGDLWPWPPESESQLSEDGLTLSNPQADGPLLLDIFGKGLSIPGIGAQAAFHRTSPKRILDHLQLFTAEPWWSSGSLRIGKTGQSLLFETIHPVGDSPGGICKQRCDLGATNSLRDQQHPMQAVIVARFIGATDLILQGQDDSLRFSDMDSFHSGDSVTPLCLFRIELWRCALSVDYLVDRSH